MIGKIRLTRNEKKAKRNLKYENDSILKFGYLWEMQIFNINCLIMLGLLKGKLMSPAYISDLGTLVNLLMKNLKSKLIHTFYLNYKCTGQVLI